MRKKNANKTYEIDMCEGPLLGKILLFSTPLMLSGILQLLFNAADIIVVGRYAGSTALAAVGSTSSLINLMINVFIGLSVGTNVLIARFYGAKQREEISQTVHTAISLSIISGLFLTLTGFLFSKPLLLVMGTPSDVISQSTLYMRIYFFGMPVIMLYNFGSAILRATGDTKRPLYYLLFAGIINVILNLIFVIVFHMGVAGVSLATVLSQCISAGLVVFCLIRECGDCHLDIKKLTIHKDKMFKILQIGLPAGIQGALFSASNVLIQSSINSFGSVAMAGSTAAANIEGFIYTAMNSMHQTAVSFTSQNYGARKIHRINKILFLCLVIVCMIGITLGTSAYYFGNQLLRIYSTDPKVIAFGLLRMRIICVTYALCGIMDVLVGTLRGLGYSVMPMIVSLLGACGLRILWIFTVFQLHHTLISLYLSYPITWIITATAHAICFYFVRSILVKNRD